jgi:hypothetical protein
LDNRDEYYVTNHHALKSIQISAYLKPFIHPSSLKQHFNRPIKLNHVF